MASGVSRNKTRPANSNEWTLRGEFTLCVSHLDMRNKNGRQIGVGGVSLISPFSNASKYTLHQHTNNGSASFESQE
jgi:hypothetical protein